MDLVDLFLCQLLFGRCGLSTGPGSFDFLTVHAPPHEEAPARASAAASRMPVELNVAPETVSTSVDWALMICGQAVHMSQVIS